LIFLILWNELRQRELGSLSEVYDSFKESFMLDAMIQKYSRFISILTSLEISISQPI